MKQYLLDTNIFIEASKRYYRPSICQSFWDFLKQPNPPFYSIKQVYDEIRAGTNSDDFLHTFSITLKEQNFFIDFMDMNPTKIIQNELISMGYSQEVITDFFNVADFYLVACAYIHKSIIVTHEKGASGGNLSKKRVKIPDICKQLNITCIDTFDFLEQNQASITLTTPQ